MLTLDEAKQLAAEHGLTLCDHCEHPREMHVGFDHGAGKCLVARNSIDLVIRFQDHEERVAVVERINRYDAAHHEAEQSSLFAGAGI